MAGITGGTGYHNSKNFVISQEMRNCRFIIDPVKYMLNLNY